jgi:hypothetical protein
VNPIEVKGAGHEYQAFGLRIRSSLQLPQMLPATGEGEPDACIDCGTVPAELPEAVVVRKRFQAATGAFLLRIEGVARYLVTGGRRIVVEPEPGADDEDVRLFLLGSALGALLHQRHDLVLHGSAIGDGGGCALFLGASGSGKSTLALALRQRGHPVLADDLSVVRADRDGLLALQPGYPQAKLWLDSLACVDIDAAGLPRVRRSLDKRALPLGASFLQAPRPVSRIYILRAEERDDIHIEPLRGSDRLAALRRHTYRFRYLESCGSKAAHFRSAAQLAQRVPLAVVRRPGDLRSLGELVDRLEAEFRAAAGDA